LLHLVGDLFELYDDARTYKPKKKKLIYSILSYFVSFKACHGGASLRIPVNTNCTYCPAPSKAVQSLAK